MAFNFKNVTIQEQKYERRPGGKPRGQTFKFKFRPSVSEAGKAAIEESGGTFVPVLSHQFVLCRDYMEQFDIQNHSIAVLVDEDQKTKTANSVALAITPEGHPKANTFVKKGDKNKGDSFSNPKLMLRLVEAGIIAVPEVDEKSVPVDDEDPLLNKNQYLDLEKIAEVVEITEGEEGYMEPTEEGEGMAIYEIVQGEEIKGGSDEDVEYEDVGQEAEEEVEA